MHACTINSTGSDSGSLTLCVYRMVKSVSEGTFAEVHVYRDGETLAIKVLIADSYLLNSEFGVYPYVQIIPIKGSLYTGNCTIIYGTWCIMIFLVILILFLLLFIQFISCPFLLLLLLFFL